MLGKSTLRMVSAPAVKEATSKILSTSRSFSEPANNKGFNEQQATYYTAKDVEFCPNRHREVMQNSVEEVAKHSHIDEKSDGAQMVQMTSSKEDASHMDAYRADNSVSLYSVMQSNVPEPVNTKDKAFTHLNMPGSSSSRDSKYLSGKIQTTHHSRQ